MKYRGKKYTAFNETKTLREWSEDKRCEVTLTTLASRVNNYNWEIEEALTVKSQDGRIAFGETKTLNKWAQDKRCKVPCNILKYRVNVLKWSVEDAILTEQKNENPRDYSNTKNYIYFLLNPTKPGNFVYGDIIFDFEPFYVGRSFESTRCNDHIVEAKNINKINLKCNIIRKIHKNKKEVIIKIINNDISYQESLEKEKFYIALIGRRDKKLGPLANLTDGGEGGNGYIVSERERKRRSEFWSDGRLLGEKNPNFGNKWTEEQKIKMSKEKKQLGQWKGEKNPKFNNGESIKGENNPMYGVPVSRERKLATSKANSKFYYIITNTITGKSYKFDSPMEFKESDLISPFERHDLYRGNIIKPMMKNEWRLERFLKNE